MSIIPEGEDLRKAVRWISDERQADPSRSIRAIIEAACLKFNLSPRDAVYLEKLVAEPPAGD